MASIHGLPEDEKTWQTLKAKVDASGKSKGLDEGSGSRIEFSQYLKLKTLWAVDEELGDIATFQHGIPEATVETAKQQLGNLQPWNNYLKYLANPKHDPSTPLSPDLGVFALVLKHQQEVSTVIPAHDESKAYTAKTHDLRARTEVYYAVPEDTPSRPSRSGTGDNFSTPINTITQGVKGIEISPNTPLAQAKALDIEMFPNTPDEQIVNTALLDFLSAITIHLPCLAHWTLHRKEFRLAGFKARVDGYLAKTGTTDIKAIIEVKAAIRNRDDKLSRVRMQEAAQMAAWIYTDMEEVGCFNMDNGRKRRVLISQDRHQIFLTFADYGLDYINYLKKDLDDGGTANKKIARPTRLFTGASGSGVGSSSGRSGESAARGTGREQDDFLRMREFGPFKTESRGHMSLLGIFILALATQMCA